MFTILTAPRMRLRKPTYPVNAVFPLSWAKSEVVLKAAGNSITLTVPFHYPRVPEATTSFKAKRDSVDNGRSYDIPKEVVEPIIESWHSLFKAWSFNAPWGGGSVAQLALMVEVVKPKRLNESADLLTYPAFKYAIEEYIEAHYHHIYVNNKRLTLYSSPEQWDVNRTKNSPYISTSLLRQGGHIRHILNFLPLDSKYFICFGFLLDRGGRAVDEQEVEKQIPAAPMIKMINEIMATVEVHRKGSIESEEGFLDEKFVEEAKANPLVTEKSESFPLLAG